MAQQGRASALDTTVQETRLWLKDILEASGRDDEHKALAMLRAVLETLRDRLTLDEAAHLGAQLPMLVRGIYYEGWKPSRQPVKLRSQDEFIQAVNDKLGGHPEIPPQEAIEAVLTVLNQRITGGEIEDIKQMLPQELRQLWPES